MSSKSRPWDAKWKIERELAGGGQGATRLVSALSASGQLGVLKTLKRRRSPKDRGRMRIEVVSLDVLAKQGCKVPHVLDNNVDSADDPELELFFVMEYIPGTSLNDLLKERGRLPLDRAVAVTLDLCATVAAAHKSNILHRDLKPNNIIVRNIDDPDLVVVDFGLSFNQDEDEGLTQTDEQMRSRFLALPEATVEGGDRRDKRSDVTALAAVFCFCLTKHNPGQLRDSNNRAPHRRPRFSVREVLGNDPRREQVELLLDRAFALEVENRFQSVEELERRLRAVLIPTSLSEEDPTQVIAELARDLRQRDRKIWLTQHHQPAKALLHQALTLALRAIHEKSAPFVVSLGMWSVEKALLPGFDLVSDPLSINVGIPPYDYSCALRFGIAAKGKQCALIRAVVLSRSAKHNWGLGTAPPGEFGGLINQ